MILDDINKALNPSGLMVRGGFYPTPDAGVPPGFLSVVLIGNVGPDMWQAFSGFDDTSEHPLDDWTSDVIGDVAASFGAGVLFPFNGPPYYPFQKWSMRADDVHISPIGPLIHPRFGLWHAYRGALLFAEELAFPESTKTTSPCNACEDKPCLSTCPVGAFSDAGYDVPACRGHIGSEAGSDCLDRGCLARRACPIGRDYMYEAPQAAFHMDRFLRAK